MTRVHLEEKHDRLWFFSDGAIRFVKHIGGKWRFMTWPGPKLDPRRLPK